ncbi:MAG: hypothetical protein A2015_15065 [Spirochaetes bacterium GWF1_31_7]|nr:MAG: hypothetical protein A2Y30_08700 [Spirochaetes bacterium GWE1_32_154]OHD48483.1 MAG: hypothetical protein A2015_15065 [Spirochaetes bacterium GWF1_31_7]
MGKIFKNITFFVPLDKKMVFFESHMGKQYSCMPRAISEYLIENSDYKIIWCFNRPENYQSIKGVKIIKRLSPQYYYYLARSKYFVLNQPLPRFIKKKYNQIFLQTWHGTPLKKIGGDVHYEDIEKVKAVTHNWNYLISQNSYSTEILKRAFFFKKEVIEEGYPKNDRFLKWDKTKIHEIKKSLKIPFDKKIILYAPTWRDDSRNDFKLQLDLKDIKTKIGNDWVIILRLHSVLSSKLTSKDIDNQNVFDYSSYDFGEELMAISDVMITDYSSIMFDYSVLTKPIIFYAYDLTDYGDKLRGMYLDYHETVPGPVVQNQSDLISEIKNLSSYWNRYKDKYTNFRAKFVYKDDGESTDRVVNRVFKKRNGKWK